MIAIGNVLISDEIISEKFVCDLNKCKGACCVDGDAGAPLNEDELARLEGVYPVVKKYLTEEGIAVIEDKGTHEWNDEFGWVTTVIKGKMCTFGITDAAGIVKCGIEQAFNDKLIDWKKPISCHLFPIRISQSDGGETDFVNYEPREDTCSAACRLGKKLQVPVYKFLEEPLVRKYGADFYEALSATAEHMKGQ